MKVKAWLAAILLVVLVIVALGFTKFTQIQAAIAFGESFPEPSATVKSVYAQTTQYTQTVKVVGQLSAPKQLTLSNEYPGLVSEVNYKPGDLVEKGQALIKLDTRIEAANLAAAKARLALAQSTFKRFEALLKQKRISQEEVDQARANLLVAEAEVTNLSLVIAKKTLSAPFAGRVGLEQYEVGQYLDGNTQLTTLVGVNPTIWLDFSLPQTIQQLAIGDTVTVQLIGQGDTAIPAKVIAKTAQINAGSRQQGYRAELNNTDNQFTPNQIVSVFVPVATNTVVAVPTNAITRNHFGEFVYVLEKDAAQNWRAKPVKVTLGDKVHDQQMVLSGLSGGEFIAAEGAFKLSENLLVYTEQTAQRDNGGM